MLHDLPRFLLRAAAPVLAALSPLAVVSADEARPVVAEATLVIGTARLSAAGGTSRGVEKGTAVRIGDRIETDVGGHVHLRFVDGARVSVRPASRLAVEDYSRATAEGRGAIRFRLEEGVMRSITGQWGEAARDSFRLNTPLAAIGIKGTDFVARTDGQRTLASVFTGSIVMSPLDSRCAATVGPCLNGLEALLTQEQRGQVLQLASAQTPQPASIGADATSARGERPTILTLAGRARTVSDDELAPVPLAEAGSKALSTAQRTVDALAASVAYQPPKIEQLSWGRWSCAQAIPGDTLAGEINAAFREGREGLISNGAFSLYRTLTGPSSAVPLPQQDTNVNFRLAGGSAYVVRGSGLGQPDPATVQGGSLAINFGRSTFSTQLDVQGPTIGNVSIGATGSVLTNGIFLSTAGNAVVAGGLSQDRREAGYLFERSIDGGHLRGITLWGP